MTTHSSIPIKDEAATKVTRVDAPGAQRIETIRFGDVDVPPEEILTFPKGLLGFEQCRRYVIIETPDSDPFKWLQSMDEPSLAFVIVNPLIFFSDYHIDVSGRELQEIDIADADTVEVYVIISVPDGDLTRMSANLQGPLIFNLDKQLAKQLVLATGEYKPAHRLMKDTTGTATTTKSKPKSPTSRDSR